MTVLRRWLQPDPLTPLLSENSLFVDIGAGDTTLQAKRAGLQGVIAFNADKDRADRLERAIRAEGWSLGRFGPTEKLALELYQLRLAAEPGPGVATLDQVLGWRFHDERTLIRLGVRDFSPVLAGASAVLARGPTWLIPNYAGQPLDAFSGYGIAGKDDLTLTWSSATR